MFTAVNYDFSKVPDQLWPEVLLELTDFLAEVIVNEILT